MTKQQTINCAFRFLSTFGGNIHEKFTNICKKTAQYEVPTELYQKRTNRKNRALIPWRDVINNNLTIEQLNTFEGGVTIEFVNNDYFDEQYNDNEIFNDLKTKLGSDENVSAIISIRSTGSSSSEIQRNAFSLLTNNTEFFYRGSSICINKDNFRDYKVERYSIGGRSGNEGCGNEKWKGFIFVSIRGGQQDTIKTHTENSPVFNPACEYASEKVQQDINLVSAYFAFFSIDPATLTSSNRTTYYDILKDISKYLYLAKYHNQTYNGNLLDYCNNHLSLRLTDGKLTDPIQAKPIKIQNFNIKDINNEEKIDFTHNEAVNFNKYYWDTEQSCILGPTRPTNIFWSLHESNMMQQNRTLEQFFEMEEERYCLRKELLSKDKK